VYQWEIAMCGPPAKLGVNYIPANSEDGRSNFVNGLNDFAVTATPFTDDQKTALDKAGRTFQYAPLTTSGLVLAYKVFDQDAAHAEPGAQVTDLKLTPELAARIFTGQLTNWHVDSEINALNPGHVFPPSVRALVRGDHSAANLEFTSWLSAAGGSALPTDWPGPGEDYPLKYLVQDSGIVGGDKLADAIADPKTASLNTDYFNAGYIGFIDSSQASYYGLPTAKIENAAGQFVTATSQSISAALSHATTNGDGVTVSPNFADTNPDDYPMPMVTYVTAPTSKVYEGRGITLRNFLTYAVGDAQTTLPDGYFPLSAAMVQQTQDAIAKVPTSTAPAPGSGGSPYPTGNQPGPGTVPLGGTTPVYPTGGAGPVGNVPGGTVPVAATGCTDGSKSAKCASAPVPDLPVGVLQIDPARLVLPGVAALSALGLLGGLALLGLPGGIGSRLPRLRLRP
ncbi:MAG: substrate-binding domain-containing protein, partial [Gaiellales bacterium]